MPNTTEAQPERILVVATQQTANAAVAALSGHSRQTKPVGVILLGAAQDSEFAGAPVLGVEDDVARVCLKSAVTTAVVCLPSVMGEARRRVLDTLDTVGVRAVTLAPIHEALRAATGLIAASGLRESDLAALVGRTPRPVDDDALNAALAGKRVLITGAGGSIGSELARIAAARSPSMLALMDRSENALFEIDRELTARFPGVPRRVLLHDVVDEWGTRRLLSETRPQTVFHAAAHKHVPMMEDHPAQAVTNNVFGAKSIVDASIACAAERFVLISSDKAVNPSSVMGMTKRLAEIYVLSRRSGSATSLATVRFGNVLASACSVLPIWAAQISEGGPVTVTDARMTRYFMTIPEAAGLVAQAASLAERTDRPADVYVLDMGEPVRIVDLARRFIALHGLTPHEENNSPVSTGSMPLIFTGARPGEKLHEELAYDAEDLAPTPIPGILAWQSGPITADFGDAMIAELSPLRASADRGRILSVLRRWTPDASESTVCSDDDRVSLAQAS